MTIDHLAERDSIVAAARAFAKLGYVHAFGHVSIRTEAGMLITPTRPPFVEQSPADLLTVGLDGTVIAGDARRRPIEAFLHAAIYVARPDAGAICRTHAPHASAVTASAAVPPIRHGFGGMAERVAFLDEVDLVHDPASGRRAAAALGECDAMILRGNGVLAVGADVGEAAARMWSLEERCSFDALCRGCGVAFSPDDLAARKRWYAAEAGRVWVWLQMLGAGPRAG